MNVQIALICGYLGIGGLAAIGMLWILRKMAVDPAVERETKIQIETAERLPVLYVMVAVAWPALLACLVAMACKDFGRHWNAKRVTRAYHGGIARPRYRYRKVQ